MTRALLAFTLALAGCAPAAAECPRPPTEPTPDAAPASEAELPGSLSFEAGEATPAPVREQFGRLVGVWSC
jgi:hypothetical protein